MVVELGRFSINLLNESKWKARTVLGEFSIIVDPTPHCNIPNSGGSA